MQRPRLPKSNLCPLVSTVMQIYRKNKTGHDRKRALTRISHRERCALKVSFRSEIADFGKMESRENRRTVPRSHLMSLTGPPQYDRAAETNNSVRISTIKDRKGRR